MIQIKEIKTLTELKEIETQWNNLLFESYDNHIFMRHEWAYNWLLEFKIPEFKIFLLYAADELVGIIPLKLEKNVFSFIGIPECDYLSFIIKKGMADPVILSFLEHIVKTYPECIVDLDELSSDSVIIKHYSIIKNDKRLISIRKHHNTTFPLKLLDSFPEMEKKIFHTRLKKSIKRGLKKLSKEGLEPVYYKTRKIEDVDFDMEEFFRIHLLRMRDRNQQSHIENEQFKNFHKKIAKLFFQSGFLNLEFLQLNGENVSCNYSFQYKNRIYCYLSGLVPEHYEHSIGNLTFKYSMIEGMKNKIKIFDFLRGAHSYKNLWGTEENKNYRVVLMKKNLKNRFYILKNFNDLFQAKNRLKTKLKTKFPKIYQYYRNTHIL